MTKTTKRILDDEQVAEVCRMREAGWSLTKISRAMGQRGISVSPGSIAWTCLRAGADLPIQRRQTHSFVEGTMVVKRGDHLVRRYTAEEDRQILEMEADGASVASIARRLDRKHNSVIGRLAALARRQARSEEIEGALS